MSSPPKITVMLDRCLKETGLHIHRLTNAACEPPTMIGSCLAGLSRALVCRIISVHCALLLCDLFTVPISMIPIHSRGSPLQLAFLSNMAIHRSHRHNLSLRSGKNGLDGAAGHLDIHVLTLRALY